MLVVNAVINNHQHMVLTATQSVVLVGFRGKPRILPSQLFHHLLGPRALQTTHVLDDRTGHQERGQANSKRKKEIVEEGGTLSTKALLVASFFFAAMWCGLEGP